MKSSWIWKTMGALALTASVMISATPVMAQTQSELETTEHKFVVSIYAGWMPWYYAWENGIVQKWAEKYRRKVKFEYMNYPNSIAAYTGKAAEGVVITATDTYISPASAGIDSTMLICGDFSNDNDGVLTRGIDDIRGLKGQRILLCEGTVSDQLLERALEKAGLKRSDVTIVNTTDDKIEASFRADESIKVCVTWNPMKQNLLQIRGVKCIFGSARIPGEIQDWFVIRTDVLQKDPALGEMLTGIWYEVLDLMGRRGPEADAVLTKMAESSECTLAAYKGQLETTAMFWKPQDAVDFVKAPKFKEYTDSVRQFCFKRGLLGENVKSVDEFGTLFPDGSVLGNKAKIRVRFDNRYMQKAADGKLK